MITNFKIFENRDDHLVYYSNDKIVIQRSIFYNQERPGLIAHGPLKIGIIENSKPDWNDIVDGISQIIHYKYRVNKEKLKEIEIWEGDYEDIDWVQPLFYLIGGYDGLWKDEDEKKKVSWSEIINDIGIYSSDLISISKKSENLYELYKNLLEINRKMKKKLPQIIADFLINKNAVKFGL
jgi:hypothetical protein